MALHADGEGGDRSAHELEGHLAGCDRCASEWTRLIETELRLRGQTMAEPPAQLVPLTMRKVRLAQVLSLPRAWSKGDSVMLEAAAVVAGVAWTMTLASDILAAGRPGRVFLEHASVVAQGALTGLGPGAGSPAASLAVELALSLAVALAWFGALIMPRTLVREYRRTP
jgi:anti-sigma factor RsiW